MPIRPQCTDKSAFTDLVALADGLTELLQNGRGVQGLERVRGVGAGRHHQAAGSHSGFNGRVEVGWSGSTGVTVAPWSGSGCTRGPGSRLDTSSRQFSACLRS